MPESEQRGAVLEKTRKYSRINNSPFHLKKQVMDQCILPTMTYGSKTWSLNKQMTNKLRTAQRAMERKMLDLNLKDKIPCSEIRKKNKDHRYHRIHTETEVEMGRSYSKIKGQ